jgi:hypothetical protein
MIRTPWVREHAALCIAHPGHELRVHGWLEIAKPVVFVLTDGSGHTGASRLETTTGVLHAAACGIGSLYGRFTDAALYEAIRCGDPDPFIALVRELALAFADRRIDCVVGDALEGFNPGHDMCRFLVNAAVMVSQKQNGSRIENLDFLLDGSPSGRKGRRGSTRLVLGDKALERKLTAAREYAEIRPDVESALARFGADAFRHESLMPVADLEEGVDRMTVEPPQYERWGEERVAAGFYDQVIRYRTHIRPLVRELWSGLGLEIHSRPTTSTSASAATGFGSRSSQRIVS